MATKKKAGGPTTYVHRDSITGRFVTKTYADLRKRTTQRQRVTLGGCAAVSHARRVKKERRR